MRTAFLDKMKKVGEKPVNIWLVIPGVFLGLYLAVKSDAPASAAAESQAGKVSATQPAGEPNPAASSDEEVQALGSKLFGSNNVGAQRVAKLGQSNAMAAGMSDGSKDAMNMYLAQQWTIDNYTEKLAEFIEAKNSYFTLLGSQNKFDPAVFVLYQRGWNMGANSFHIDSGH